VNSQRRSYGYGPTTWAGLFVIAMIMLSSGLAAYEAIARLIHLRDVTHLWAPSPPRPWGAFVGNEIVARCRIRVGRRIGSAALVADGLQAPADGFASLAGNPSNCFDVISDP
jgi:divalent metal cation (Fe/Co/Zn/Cd) transporter